VNETNDLHVVFGQATAHHEPDVLVLANAEAIRITDNFHCDVSS
jgi:hypothetical protein